MIVSSAYYYTITPESPITSSLHPVLHNLNLHLITRRHEHPINKPTKINFLLTPSLTVLLVLLALPRVHLDLSVPEFIVGSPFVRVVLYILLCGR